MAYAGQPNIALQVPQVQNPIEQLSNWQRLGLMQQQMQQAQAATQQTQAATEVTRAQLPGVQAQAQENERIARRNKMVEEITASHRRVNPDGTTSFDMHAAADALAKAGFGKESIDLRSGFLDNIAKDIANATSTQHLT